MQSISRRIGRHDMVLDVHIENVRNGLVDIKQGNPLHQGQGIVFPWKIPVLQFVENGFARQEFKVGPVPLGESAAAGLVGQPENLDVPNPVQVKSRVAYRCRHGAVIV